MTRAGDRAASGRPAAGGSAKSLDRRRSVESIAPAKKPMPRCAKTCPDRVDVGAAVSATGRPGGSRCARRGTTARAATGACPSVTSASAASRAERVRAGPTASRPRSRRRRGPRAAAGDACRSRRTCSRRRPASACPGTPAASRRRGSRAAGCGSGWASRRRRRPCRPRRARPVSAWRPSVDRGSPWRTSRSTPRPSRRTAAVFSAPDAVGVGDQAARQAVRVLVVDDRGVVAAVDVAERRVDAARFVRTGTSASRGDWPSGGVAMFALSTWSSSGRPRRRWLAPSSVSTSTGSSPCEVARRRREADRRGREVVVEAVDVPEGLDRVLLAVRLPAAGRRGGPTSTGAAASHAPASSTAAVKSRTGTPPGPTSSPGSGPDVASPRRR